MKTAESPLSKRNCILRVSVRTGRNFSPALNVLSMTAPSSTRLSLVRTKAPPLPGLTSWNSTMRKTLPSTSMWVPFLNWLVLTMRAGRLAASSARDLEGEGGVAVRLDSDDETVLHGDQVAPPAIDLQAARPSPAHLAHQGENAVTE